jgi:hypothetical protein
LQQNAAKSNSKIAWHISAKNVLVKESIAFEKP